MLRNTFHKLKMRLAAIAPRIFGADSSLLQKLSATTLLKSNQASALSKAKAREQEKCQKRQEIIDRCFAPAEPFSYKNNLTQILASTDAPKDPPTDKLKDEIIVQVFSDDLTKKTGQVGKIELAASNTQEQEKLITKIESIKEAPLIHEEASLRDTVHSNVFGERLSQYSVNQSFNTDFKDIAERCLLDQEHDYDSALLREVERIAVPLIQRSENSDPNKEKSIFEKYDYPIDAILRDAIAMGPLKNIDSNNLGPPFETLLVREPTIFKDDKEAPTFQTTTSTPQHFFQEPLLTQTAPQATETLRVTHHSASSVEPKFKPVDLVEIQESFFDDEPAYEEEPALPEEKTPTLNTSSKIIDLATSSEAPRFKEHEIVEEVTPEVRELPKNVEANMPHLSAAAKPAAEAFKTIQPQAKPMEHETLKPIQTTHEPLRPRIVPAKAATEPQELLMEAGPSPAKAHSQSLNEKDLTLKQLLERIRRRSRIDYCRRNLASEKAVPEASYPYQNPPSCPMPPACPGGKPMCVPPCGTPAGPCPGPNSKPQCIPPCEMPAGPCPPRKPSGSKCESTSLNPFIKDIVMMLIQVGVVAGPRPAISRIFSSFLYTFNICAFAKLSNDFVPFDRLEMIKCYLNARNYEPWTPIPSWPIPRSEKKQPFVCPKEGCKLIPPPKLHPPCLENPCKNLPIPGTHYVPFSCNRIYNVGDF